MDRIIVGIDLGNNNTLFSVNIKRNGVLKVVNYSAISGKITDIKENTDLMFRKVKSKKASKKKIKLDQSNTCFYTDREYYSPANK